MSDKEFQSYLVQKIDRIYADINSMRKLAEKESRDNFEEHSQFKTTIETILNLETDREKMCARNMKDMQKNIDSIRFLPLFWEWFKKDWKYVSIAIVLLNINNAWPIIREIIQMFSF